MNNKFKMEKFNKNDSGTVQIRHESLSNGKMIAFGIAMTDLTALQFVDDEIDFDQQSDRIIENFRDSTSNRAFMYDPDGGFIETNTSEQIWFRF